MKTIIAFTIVVLSLWGHVSGQVTTATCKDALAQVSQAHFKKLEGENGVLFRYHFYTPDSASGKPASQSDFNYQRYKGKIHINSQHVESFQDEQLLLILYKINKVAYVSPISAAGKHATMAQQLQQSLQMINEQEATACQDLGNGRFRLQLAGNKASGMQDLSISYNTRTNTLEKISYIQTEDKKRWIFDVTQLQAPYEKVPFQTSVKDLVDQFKKKYPEYTLYDLRK